MRITFDSFPIFNSNGSQATVLDGEYEAEPNAGQQPGWYALRKVNAAGEVDPEVEANFHMFGFV